VYRNRHREGSYQKSVVGTHVQLVVCGVIAALVAQRAVKALRRELLFSVKNRTFLGKRQHFGSSPCNENRVEQKRLRNYFLCRGSSEESSAAMSASTPTGFICSLRAAVHARKLPGLRS
jgi:hypothetical protein